MSPLQTRAAVQRAVRRIVNQTPVLLWGLDELLTYHYLVAEVHRRLPMPYADFWALPKAAQAELIWDHLFVRHSPISEACRGVLTCLKMLGLDPKPGDLKKLRAWFKRRKVEAYVDKVFRLAKVRGVVMTNNPFDENERPVWLESPPADARFRAALRLDNLLLEWPHGPGPAALERWGYRVTPTLTEMTLAEVRRFLHEWIERTDAVYMAVSLPPDFRYPDRTPLCRLIEDAVLPVACERGLPLALMIGVKKRVNPDLAVAGDGVGKADNASLEYLCRRHPEKRFLATYLSRENQHELCVTARKFGNLHPFGCWWFLNDPSIIEEITRERIELLGTSFTPQHSDARVLDQLLYKWRHSREVIAGALADKFADAFEAGWPVTQSEIQRTVEEYFGGAFEAFLAGTPRA